MAIPKALCRYAAFCIVGSVLHLVASMARAEDIRVGTIVPVSRTLCDDMKNHNVIRAGAVVGCERLSLIKFSYLGYDGAIHDDGEIMVMDAAAENVLRIFTRLREMRFPIAKARLINHYDGSDDASIADDNTSAFNSRNVAGTNALSLHAYGLAIDLNPLENPYVQYSGGKPKFSPPAGAAHTNRFKGQPEKQLRLGLAEAAIDVFADEGFSIWGGYWKSAIDYQHFQVSRGLAEQLARLAPARAKAVFAEHVERYRNCRKTGEPAASREKCVALDGQP